MQNKPPPNSAPSPSPSPSPTLRGGVSRRDLYLLLTRLLVTLYIIRISSGRLSVGTCGYFIAANSLEKRVIEFWENSYQGLVKISGTTPIFSPK